MYHELDEYPYDYEEVPDVAALIDELDWDVLCVFDACRWDAFEEVCDASEPVCSPGSNTPKWTSRLWCNDEYDWSDVTYITGNPHTTTTRRGPEDGKEWSGKLEDHVGEYVEAFDNDEVWGDQDKTSQPETLTDVALEYEPPIVVHYMQPHEPFIGSVQCSFNLPQADDRPDYITDIDERFEDYPSISWLGDEIQLPNIYYLVITGVVSPEYIRLAYMQNLRRAWKASRDIRNEFETVITTADHGERLGADTYVPPELDADEVTADNDADDSPGAATAPGQLPNEWGHDGETSQGRVIPFHINNPDLQLPDPQSVGGADSHEWVLDQHS